MSINRPLQTGHAGSDPGSPFGQDSGADLESELGLFSFMTAFYRIRNGTGRLSIILT